MLVGHFSLATRRRTIHSGLPRITASAADVSRRAKLGSSIEVKGLFVSLDRIALRFPARQSTFEEFHPQEMHGLSSLRDDTAGFITSAGTVNDRVLLFRDERWILKQVIWGESSLHPR